jgi:tetratricopeptide (TPR) repeat protein
MEARSLLKNTSFHVVLLLLLGLFVYSNTFNVPFQFDDVPNISENPIVKDLYYFSHPSAARKFTGFAEYRALKSRYIGHLSFALNWWAGGPNVAGFHAVNIAIHLFSTLLVYALVILIFRTPFMQRSRLRQDAPYIALFAAALFSVHPLQTQAITYIVQRLASMAAMLYLASLTSYMYSRLTENRAKKVVFYVLALLAAVLGMKTKENVFTLPLAIAAFEIFFFSGAGKKRLALWVPFGLAMLIIPLTLISQGASSRALMENLTSVTRARNIDIPRGEYFITELRVLITYLRLIFVPIQQHLLYAYPYYKSILNPNVLLSAVFHLGMLSLGGYLFLRSRTGEPALRVLAMGILWFYLTLSVESTVVPLFMIYEHRLYLPAAGVFTAISVGAFLFFASLESRKGRTVLSTAMVAIILILGGTAFARNYVWQSEQSLWEDNVRKAPNSPQARSSLGDVYAFQGQYDRAAVQYEAALAVDPEFTGAMINLANIHLIQGRVAVAADLYKKVLGIDPSLPEAYNNLGMALMQLGKTSEAVRYFQASIDRAPRQVRPHVNLGKALLKMGDRRNAVRQLEDALKLAPADPEALALLNQAQDVQ